MLKIEADPLELICADLVIHLEDKVAKVRLFDRTSDSLSTRSNSFVACPF